jgi:hypothetical protein
MASSVSGLQVHPAPESGALREHGCDSNFATKARPWALRLTFVIAIGIICAVIYRPATRALFRLQGYSLVFDRTAINVMVRTPGDSGEAVFSATNISGQAITVHGIETPCGCVTLNDLPLIIPAGESRKLVFKVTTKPTSGGHDYELEGRVFIDVPSPPVLVHINLTVCSGSHPVRDSKDTGESALAPG